MFLAEKMLSYHDNAPVHLHRLVVSKLNELRYELVFHSPHSADPTLSDCFLFLNLKKSPAGKRLASNGEVIASTDGYFADLEASHFFDDFRDWSTV